MPFVKHKQPCPACGGSDPVSVNDNGTGWCFSCNTHLPQYSTAEVQQPDTVTDFEVYQRNSKMVENPTASFSELTDRKISLDTAKKYVLSQQKQAVRQISTTILTTMDMSQQGLRYVNRTKSLHGQEALKKQGCLERTCSKQVVSL